MKKILVVVDYQKDFVDGALGFEDAKKIEKGIYNKVKWYLDNNYKVIFTYDTHKDNYLDTREGKNLPVVHCVEGTEGHELYGILKEFKDKENTIHINKVSFGLSPEELIEIRNNVGREIEEIEIVGVVTDICVISNVVTMQSTFPESKIIVDSKLCSSFDKEQHEKALSIMKSIQAIVL